MTGSSRYGAWSPPKCSVFTAAEDLRRAIARIGVGERADAFHRIGRVRQRRVGAVVLVVLAAHGEPDAIARRHHDAGRPDLDVELDRLARRERPLLVVGVPRPIGQGALRDRACGARRAASPGPTGVRGSLLPMNDDLLARGIEHAQHQEEVGVGRVRRHEQLGRDRAGDLHLLRHRRREEGQPVAGRLVGQRAASAFGCSGLRLRSSGWR